MKNAPQSTGMLSPVSNVVISSWTVLTVLSVRKCIAARREALGRRRELLEQAQQLQEQDLKQEARTEETISEERYVDDPPAIFRPR